MEDRTSNSIQCVCVSKDVLETGNEGAADVDVEGIEILICAARACARSRTLAAQWKVLYFDSDWYSAGTVSSDEQQKRHK